MAYRFRWVVFCQHLSVVLTVSLAGSACSSGSDQTSTAGSVVGATTSVDPLSSPTSTLEPAASLPPLQVEASAVSAWLSDDGAALAEVRRIGAEVSDSRDALSAILCDGWVQQLSDGPSPEELVEVAGRAPDPVIGDALGGAVVALNRVLSVCATGEPPGTESLEQLAAQLALVDEREASL